MVVEIGIVEALYRYPIKSMAGEQLESALMGLHGLEGDRRLALRKVDDRSGFPWLTATRVPELLQYTPLGNEDGALPTHVRTPASDEWPIYSDELALDIAKRHGSPVQMTYLRNGIFDDASISVIATDTVREITQSAGLEPDARRFRPNVVVRLLLPGAYQENAWVGGSLHFGEGDDVPILSVTMCDPRCAMVNFDPDTVKATPDVLKTVVRANENNAGVYAAAARPGRIKVGQRVFLNAR